MKKVNIIGIGMNGRETLTMEANSAISSADCLIGAARMLEPFSSLAKPCFTSWNYSDISEYIASTNFDTYAVLMSGDCGFFSGTEGLLKALPDSVDAQVISGISSPVYFCDKIKIPWQGIPTVNLHGETSNIIRSVSMHHRCFFLLGGKIGAKEICEQLCEFGMQDAKVYIGEMLAYSEERILSGSAKDFIDLETNRLSVLLTENSDPETYIRTGIPDSEFVRGKVPMTKSEVRSMVISKLGISPADKVWDIGCGTGSVSVEMALQCYNGTVYAADVKPEAVSLTKQNALKFKCDNIEVFTGSAPEITADFPAPNKVFIGGSSGNMQGIISSALEKNPNAVLVITAVSLETLNEAVQQLSKHDMSADIIEVSVTRTKQVGTHTMLAAENPVFIIRGAKSCVE